MSAYASFPTRKSPPLSADVLDGAEFLRAEPKEEEEKCCSSAVVVVAAGSGKSSEATCDRCVTMRIPQGPMRAGVGFVGDKVVDDADEEEGVFQPPHEILAARSWRMDDGLAFSVVEGVGRKLKGRDLHRVRDAVWRRTGFLDGV